MIVATAAPALPNVADLSKEQRSALLVDLIKAHFIDAGMPWYLSVRDGETLLGVFHPEFNRKAESTPFDPSPEFIEEVKRSIKDIEEGRAELLTSDEFLAQVEKDLDRMHGE
jgi:hypothetical protein